VFGLECVIIDAAHQADARFALVHAFEFAGLRRREKFAPLQRAFEFDAIAIELGGDGLKAFALQHIEACEFGFARGEAGGVRGVCHATQNAPP
jgi:hypothetical protein